MNTEIYIEGQGADVTGDIAALFTYAIDDVADFSSRETTYSKTIIFPGTARNNALFGFAFEFTAFNAHDPAKPNILYNFNAAKSARCTVNLHGIQVFKGVIRLMEIRSLDGLIEYETAMFGELGGLITAIGNRLLTGNTDTSGGLTVADDLDFSDYNQAWTTTNIIQTWTDLAATGYRGYGLYYPLIDYGLTTTGRVDFSYQALRPALYVHEYIQKIFDKAGYTFECPFFETAFFLRLIVPHAEDKVYKMVRQLIDNRSSAVAPFLNSNTTRNLNFSNESSTPINFTTAYSSGGTGSTFTYAGAAVANMQIASQLVLNLSGGQGQVLVTCQILINSFAVSGVPSATYQFIMTGPGTGALDGGITVNLDVPVIAINPGDVIAVNITSTYPGVAPTNPWRIEVVSTSRITIIAQTAQSTAAVYGDDLEINNMIPKGVLQKDFLMSIVKMFNLRIIEHPDTDKHVIITPYIDFYDNADPLDWTFKVDRSKMISLKPMSEVNARYFNFFYEQDSDFDNDTYRKRYGKGYADRTVDVGLDFVKDKADLKIIFASSPLVGSSGLDKVVTRIMKLNGAVEERMASKIRILQAKRIAVSAWDLLEEDLTTVIDTASYYGYAGHVNDPDDPSGADLNFGAPAEIYWEPANPYLPINLFAEFYSPYMAEITDKDSKLLTCYVYLNPVEILNLDFSKSILIDGQLWRLNRVIDYNAVQDEVTKIEALKVIALSYP